MIRPRHALLSAVVLLFAACAAEPEPDDDLPLPPPPPPRLQLSRPSPAAQHPANGDQGAESGANGAAPDSADAPVVEAAATPPPPILPEPPPWRVIRDGVVGCADPASLRLLRLGADTTPRLLAEARAAGGCRTTFRVNVWSLEGQDGDLVRLRLTNGPLLTLWFLRADVLMP